MRQAFVFETFEPRSLLSAAPTAVRSVATAGPGTGNYPAAGLPQFTELHGSAHDSSDNVITPEPSNGLDRDTAIKITFTSNGNGAIDTTQLFRSAVRITDTTTGTVLKSVDSAPGANDADLSKVITSGGGDVIVISLKTLLSANHTFTVELNGSYAQGTNSNGQPFDYRIRTGSNGSYTYFAATSFTFTTGTYFAKPSNDFTSAFDTPVRQTASGNHGYTCVTMGPDGKLYASDTQGYVYKFDVASDGTLTLAQTINTVRANNGGNRLITGIAFSPLLKSTDVPLMYVSHSAYQFGTNGSDGTGVANYAQNFSGKISTLYGTNLDTYQDYVINIPRSAKDHTNNQIIIDPKGQNAYFAVAAMNAMGAADSVWGNRPENIYTGSIMRLRLGGGVPVNGKGQYGIVGWMRDNGPVDLKIDGTNQTATGLVAGTTHYNIYAGRNPLRFWADGIRNDYDLLFHSNGHLYAGINGSSAGGNVPGTPSNLNDVPIQNRLDSGQSSTTPPRPYTGPTAPALTNVQVVEEDALLDVKENAYYGHPNPARGEYILDNGNPSGTANDDFAITGPSGYADGQAADRNYTKPIYDFGQDYSPNGLIEYRTVGGKNRDLNGYILICRYASGGDLLALQPSRAGTAISKVQARIQGLSNLGTPLDVTEDMNTGNLYVATLTDELGGGYISLIKPITTTSGTPNAEINRGKLSYYLQPGKTANQTITITNTGNGALIFDPSKTKIGGSGRKSFVIKSQPESNFVMEPGDSVTLTVAGTYPKGTSGNVGATMYLYTNDPDSDHFSVLLRAFNADTASLQAKSVAKPSAIVQNAVRPVGGNVFTGTSLIKDLDLV